LPPRGAQDGDQFWKISEVYIRGNTIKYLRIPDEVIVRHQCSRAALNCLPSCLHSLPRRTLPRTPAVARCPL